LQLLLPKLTRGKQAAKTFFSPEPLSDLPAAVPYDPMPLPGQVDSRLLKRFNDENEYE
jgi:hypothetical protein